jgi:hypothetical protein
MEPSVARHWEIPTAEPHVYQDKRSAVCIVSAAWDEGPASIAQYERMRAHTARFDFIVANRGRFLGSLDAPSLRALNLNTLIQVDVPGQSAAYRAGLAWALQRGYEGIIIIDSNGKDGVGKIDEFARHLDEGVDLAQGSRFIDGGHHANTPWQRRFAIRVVAAGLLWLGTGYWYTDQTNGFKAFSRRFLLDPRVQPFRDVFQGHSLLVYLNYAAARHGFRIVEIPTSRVYPASGPLPTKLTSAGALAHSVDYLRAISGRFDPPA